MDTQTIEIMLRASGFDPKMAAMSAGSIPVFVAFFTFVKGRAFVPERFEALLAMAATAVLNTLVALNTAPPVQLFPALSSSATGAVLAMIGHAMLFRRSADRLSENPSASTPLGAVPHDEDTDKVERASKSSAGGPPT